MVDSVQIVLLIVVVILSILLVALGVQVFFILRDLRSTIAKANEVLDDTKNITENVSRPISFLSTLVASGKFISKLIKSTDKEK